MAKGFKGKLKKMKKLWDDGKDSPPGVPDGIYQMQLQACTLKESQNGKLYIAREHLVLEGEFEGEVVRDMISLETDQGPYYVAKFIDQMGYEVPEDVTDIPEVLETIENDASVYKASAKRSGEFTNVRIQEIIEEGAAPKEDTTPEPEKEKETEEEKPKQRRGRRKKEGVSSTYAVGDEVFFTDDDNCKSVGKIVKPEDDDNIKENERLIEDANGDLWALKISELTPADGESSEDETQAKLLAFGQACDIEGLNDEMSVKEIVKLFSDFEWPEDQLLPEEMELLHSVNIKTKPVEEKKKITRRKKTKK